MVVYNIAESMGDRVRRPYGMYGALVGILVCGAVLIALYTAKNQGLEVLQACANRHNTEVCMHELAY